MTAPLGGSMTSTDDRFQELRELLRSYEWTGHTFDDTMEAPGTALGSYLRIAAYAPRRAAAAVREIDDLLGTGLFRDEIADDVDLLPHIAPPHGVSVEDCLRVVRHHLDQFLAKPSAPRPALRPQTSWEWRRRFPALSHLLTSYFHQDFSLEYQSHAEAIADYLSAEAHEDHEAAARDINGFLAVNPTDDELQEGVRVLGLRITPPQDVPLRRWLTDLQGIITHHVHTHP
ncbi:contact-dependent growth inhibition system immunity protein [Streptomyces sp. YU58]|uniref:contact-dependent growth inhibition system immunity protein n=1 Tax=Streptomyces sp. SX92 TaxID=3158972 RepID=UPI0027BAE452|nr:contact-dependent growth inhibition system immunity protein [Streptomyces coralus]WLW52521.1 contact-dependent growth inhibition system immunity protein [Streptomyces coralus]